MARLSAEYTAVLRSSVDSKKLASVSRDADWLFGKLLLVIDSAGRFHADPGVVALKVLSQRVLKAEVSAADVERWLVELQSVGLIICYLNDGERLLEVVNFYRPKAWGKGVRWNGPDDPGSSIAPLGAVDAPDGSVAPENEPIAPAGTVTAPTGLSPCTSEQGKAEQRKAEADAREGEGSNLPQEADPPPAATAAPAVHFPDWFPDGLGKRWLDDLQSVVFTLPVVHKVRTDVVHSALVQAIVQAVPHPPDNPSPAVLKSWQSDLRAAKPVPVVSKWLRGLDANPKGRNASYLIAALKGGHDPLRWLAPGFGYDKNLAAGGAA